MYTRLCTRLGSSSIMQTGQMPVCPRCRINSDSVDHRRSECLANEFAINFRCSAFLQRLARSILYAETIRLRSTPLFFLPGSNLLRFSTARQQKNHLKIRPPLHPLSSHCFRSSKSIQRHRHYTYVWMRTMRGNGFWPTF